MGYLLKAYVHAGDENSQEDIAAAACQLAECEREQLVED